MVKMGVASTISPRKWVRAPPPNVRAAEIEPKMGEEEEEEEEKKKLFCSLSAMRNFFW